MKYKLPKTLAALLALSMLTACGTAKTSTAETAETAETETAAVTTSAAAATDDASESTDLFTDRDLTQTPDLMDAETVTLSDGDTITITDAGVYVLSGAAKNAQVIVECAEDAKVQLVLDGVTVTNDSLPAIYVKSADKVFVTTTDSENALAVTGTFTADGDTNTDAVIFSKDDLVLNGTGTLKLSSTDNAVTSKDDLKVTGGTYEITCASHGLEANDGAYISGGTLTISAGECIEATYVYVCGGTLTLSATDDGINAAYQTEDAAEPCVEIAGGDITITMAQGDTDAIDSNGSILVSGGTVNITAQFAFDFLTTASHTGGTNTVNGQTVDEITESMMMGGGMGGMGGQMPGGNGQMPGGMPGHGGQRPA